MLCSRQMGCHTDDRRLVFVLVQLVDVGLGLVSAVVAPGLVRELNLGTEKVTWADDGLLETSYSEAVKLSPRLAQFLVSPCPYQGFVGPRNRPEPLFLRIHLAMRLPSFQHYGIVDMCFPFLTIHDAYPIGCQRSTCVATVRTTFTP